MSVLRPVVAAMRAAGWVHSVDRYPLQLGANESVSATNHIWRRGTERVDVLRWVGTEGTQFEAAYSDDWNEYRMAWNQTASVAPGWVAKHGLAGLLDLARITGVLPVGGDER